MVHFPVFTEVTGCIACIDLDSVDEESAACAFQCLQVSANTVLWEANVTHSMSMQIRLI